VVISTPRELQGWFSTEVAGVPEGRFLDAAQIGEMLRDFPHMVVGPSYQGWLPPGRLVPESGGDVPRVERAEEFAEAIRVGCTDEEWSHSGINPLAGDAWVGFQDEHPVALGQLRERPGACDPCLVTHQGFRGRGFGTRVVSAMLEEADANAERLVLYQTLMSNAGGLAIARKLGFQQYATLIAVRLSEGAF
jgi:GNAT superfamily N-acetyltransferase